MKALLAKLLFMFKAPEPLKPVEPIVVPKNPVKKKVVAKKTVAKKTVAKKPVAKKKPAVKKAKK